MAIEVVVTESPKSIKGSISTLTAVSPALGIIVLHEDEIRRGLIRAGMDPLVIDKRVARQRGNVEELIDRSSQRLVLWTFARLRRRFEIVTGSRWINTGFSGRRSE